MRHLTFAEWVVFTFGSDSQPAGLSSGDYPGPDDEALEHCISFFESPQDVLRTLDRHAACKGLWRLPGIDGYLGLLTCGSIPLDVRMHAISAHDLLFRSAFKEDDYDGASFMWWEHLAGAQWKNCPVISDDAAICSAIVEILEKILYIGTQPCAFSALHGLNEIGPFAPQPRVRAILEEFLASARIPTSGLRKYALDVLSGDAQ
jgi:hypothetical protein